MKITENLRKNNILICSVVVIFSFLIAIATILYFSLGFRCEKYSQSLWDAKFIEYFKYNDADEKIANLKQGLDDISADYIDQFMKNSRCWQKCVNYCSGCKKEENLWSKNDKKLFKEFENMSVPELYAKARFSPFKYKGDYALKDVPKEVFEKIDGKDILDLGAWPGDTAYIFHKLFPHSNIFAYEPLVESYNEMNMFFDEMKKEEPGLDLIHSVNKGVGIGEYKERITFQGRTNFTDMVSLDYDYPRIQKKPLGLIKMDVEGYESDVIKGAENIIRKYKPTFIISIYHTPEDFFGMKDKLKALNPEYHFMIRRCEKLYADGALVLVAY